jgi:2-keto-4-pentenoate hydratase
MLTDTDHETAARALRDAYSRGAIPPMRQWLEPTDVDGAYAVQEINTRFWVDQGRRIVGRKAGLTAKAVQTQLGVDQPDFGVLFEDMKIADEGSLDPARALQPKAEAEIAFVLGKDLPSPDTTPEQVADAVATVHAAIEVVDSRIADWKITFADTVADNGSSAFYVLANEGKPLHGLDIWSAGMVMEINGQIVSLGAGAAALGHPLNAAAWLAQTLAKRGEPLKAGDVLLTGALGPMVAMTPGDHIRAIVGGIGEVSFTLRRPHSGQNKGCHYRIGQYRH